MQILSRKKKRSFRRLNNLQMIVITIIRNITITIAIITIGGIFTAIVIFIIITIISMNSIKSTTKKKKKSKTKQKRKID